MKQRDVMNLWSGVNYVADATAGRTDWTTGGGYWIVRSRLLGDNYPRRSLTVGPIKMPAGRKLSSEIRRFTKDARQASRADGTKTWCGETERVAILHNGGLYVNELRVSSVRVAFNLDRFNGLCALMQETVGQFQIRVDPWQRIGSFWTLGGIPYPLAVVAGMHSESLVIDGEVQS